MNHIEGDYDEIVQYMDEHSGYGLDHVMTHGSTSDGHLNVGLFSVNSDHNSRRCVFCKNGFSSKAMFMDFDREAVYLDTDYKTHVIPVENPKTSHLIRF